MTASTTPAMTAPYRGLAPFGDSELDALLFFGRERETEVAVANLIAARLTILYGPSGVGKSSLLRAGVARRLRELGSRGAVGRGPDVAVVVFSSWAEDPVRGLADAVESVVAPLVSPLAPRPSVDASLAETIEHWTQVLDGDLCIVLDQLEEHFVYHEDEGGPGTFVDEFPELVLRTSLRANVLLSLRDDSLSRLDVFKGRVPNLFANTLRLGKLDHDAAKAAIIGPVERWNELVAPEDHVEVEHELVEAVIAQASAVDEVDRVEPPFLQLVMERVWNEEQDRGSSVLRASTLAELGGAASVVREHLARALGVLDPKEQEAAARMFEHLVTPSGTKIAHRATDLAEFARLRPAAAVPVLNALGRERILRPLDETDGDRYEIFHDVLADAILDWRRTRDTELERAAAGRRQRRLAAIAGAALVALVVMTGVSVYALSQRREARSAAAAARESSRKASVSARESRVRAREARAGELAAQALGVAQDDPARALGLAVRAASLVASRQNEAVLRSVMAGNRLLAAEDLGRPLADVRYLPDRRLLVAGEDGSVLLLSPSGRLVRTIADGGPAQGAALADRGGLAVVYGRGPARVVSVDGRSRTLGPDVLQAAFSRAGGTVVQTLRGGRVLVSDSFSPRRFRVFIAAPGARRAFPNGTASRIAVVGGDTVRMFDGTSGELLFEVPQPGATTVAFSPDGKLFATGGADGHVRLWRVRDGMSRGDFPTEKAQVLALAFNPKGRTLAAGYSDGLAQIWDIASGRLAARVTEHQNFVVGLSFSLDGNSLATWSRDKTARISKAATGVPIAVLDGHGDTVSALAFDPTRSRVATVSDDGRVRIWNVEARPRLGLMQKLPRALVGLEFRDGRLEARAAGGVEYVLDPRDGRIVSKRNAGPRTAAGGGVTAVAHGRAVEIRRDGRRLVRPAGGVVRDVAVSRDGRLVAAAAGKDAVLWSAVTGRPEHRLRRHRDIVTSVDFSRDGTRLVTAGRDHAVIVWRTVDGRQLLLQHPQFGRVSDASFSPDGRWIVTAGPETAALLNAGSGRVVFLLDGHTDELRGATFDSTGRLIYTAGLDGTVRKYRCEICGDLKELEATARKKLSRY